MPKDRTTPADYALIAERVLQGTAAIGDIPPRSPAAIQRAREVTEAWMALPTTRPPRIREFAGSYSPAGGFRLGQGWELERGGI